MSDAGTNIGSTITITSAGSIGGLFATPIINYPEVAILGMGRGRLQPAVIDKGNGETVIAPRLIMPIVLCIDHRVLDGGAAGRLLQRVAALINHPEEL